MHLYNAWLPPPVAEEAKREGESFRSVVRSVKDSCRMDDPDSLIDTLKWIPVLDLFIKAKSDIFLADVKELVEFGLPLFLATEDMYIQDEWGNLLKELLKKYGKKLSLSIDWRPIYEMILRMHFKRNTRPEGWRLKEQHIQTIQSLVQICRKFFRAGSSSEIWSEFRTCLKNPWHVSAFEGSGFLNLLIATNMENQSFFTSEWITECIDIWETVTNCKFWDNQWITLIARCIKFCTWINWDIFLPRLFTRFLNLFEIPVSRGIRTDRLQVEISSNMELLFNCYEGMPYSVIAKSIVYLLKPGSLAQQHFKILADKLEQYFYPSNEDDWTDSLDDFFWYLMIFFRTRLRHEINSTNTSRPDAIPMGKLERENFVKVVLNLMEWGQYSKTRYVVVTVKNAISMLSYVEPSLVLPFMSSRFLLALETSTTTHLLENSLELVASASRAFLLASTLPDSNNYNNCEGLFSKFLSVALLGLDANDLPKTLASMELICSIFSSLTIVGDMDCKLAFEKSICLSEWLDEFFSHLFLLIQNLESTNVINVDMEECTTTRTVLSQSGPYYFLMVQILLGKLSAPLFKQCIEKISKFVSKTVLLGAMNEVEILCSACVMTKPELGRTHIITPILAKLLSYLKEMPVRDLKESSKDIISPALEKVVVYHLKILASCIYSVGPVLLSNQHELKEAILLAFRTPSWKVNEAGGLVIHSILQNLVFYYPIDQYRSFPCQPDTCALDKWACPKGYQFGGNETLDSGLNWHIPSSEEISFANEILELHFVSALDELVRICRDKIYNNSETEKEQLKITLLQIKSSLDGVLTCLPDMQPAYKNTELKSVNCSYFLVAGSLGPYIGHPEMRERAAKQIHFACKYLLKERADDSILLKLIIFIMNALANYGSVEYESGRNGDSSLNFNAIIEPPFNFIDSIHAQGNKRPRWVLVGKAYMHNLWRSSQSSYHKYHVNDGIAPSENILLLMEDLFDLSLHNYERVRWLARRSLSKMLKRFPSLISKCVMKLCAYLCDPKSKEHVVIGSCKLLAETTLLRHLKLNSASLSSFITALLASYHHDSLKAQEAITELFDTYNNNFSGIPRKFSSTLNGELQITPGLADLVSQISSLDFHSSTLQWRYRFMADRILLLLALSSRDDSILPLKFHVETTARFLRNLRSQHPQSRMLAISALNSLLNGEKTKQIGMWDPQLSYSIRTTLSEILLRDGFLSEVLNGLSLLHDATGLDMSSTRFCYEFSALWPRTPQWMHFDSFPANRNGFKSKFADLFKRLVRECGESILHELKRAIEEFCSEKERSKQLVSAEALAGLLHSDILRITDNNWVKSQLEKLLGEISIESVLDWVNCIQYTVTGKGKHGTGVPLVRESVLDCLIKPTRSINSSSGIIAKRIYYLSVAFNEISLVSLSDSEVQFHEQVLVELLRNLNHSSAQQKSQDETNSNQSDKMDSLLYSIQQLSSIKENTETNKTETMFHFAKSSLKSGRCSYLFDMIVELIYPILSLQDISNKDLSELAMDVLELLSWIIFPRPFLEIAIERIISSIRDPNWRTRYTTLTYLEAFMHRHTFTLSSLEKLQIWQNIENLLADNQVEVREHAARVIASLMKGGYENLSIAFREQSYAKAKSFLMESRRRFQSMNYSVVHTHSIVLALASCVLSVPYDLPSWIANHITLLANFMTEPYPISGTVSKTVAEFRRTHSDSWDLHKQSFTQQQLEVLTETSLSFSYFA